MQLGGLRLNSKERQRKMRVCTAEGQLISGHSAVLRTLGKTQHSLEEEKVLVNHWPLLRCCCLCHRAGSESLTDSGAAGNFLDITLAQSLDIPYEECEIAVFVCTSLKSVPVGLGNVSSALVRHG